MQVDNNALAAAGLGGVALVAALALWWFGDDVGGAVKKLTSEHLSPNWRVADLTVSSTADRLGLSNEPGPTERNNLAFLAHEALEPILELHGDRLIVTSGYRSPEVNAAIRGASPTSDHRHGLAADFVTTGGKTMTEALFHRIREHLLDRLPIDQLIFYPERGHIHVGVRRKSPRRMAGFNVNGAPNRWLT